MQKTDKEFTSATSVTTRATKSQPRDVGKTHPRKSSRMVMNSIFTEQSITKGCKPGHTSPKMP